MGTWDHEAAVPRGRAGLPEEKAILREGLRWGYVAMALSVVQQANTTRCASNPPPPPPPPTPHSCRCALGGPICTHTRLTAHLSARLPAVWETPGACNKVTPMVARYHPSLRR